MCPSPETDSLLLPAPSTLCLAFHRARLPKQVERAWNVTLEFVRGMFNCRAAAHSSVTLDKSLLLSGPQFLCVMWAVPISKVFWQFFFKWSLHSAGTWSGPVFSGVFACHLPDKDQQKVHLLCIVTLRPTSCCSLPWMSREQAVAKKAGSWHHHWP